jgi:SEC-C motif domain protein
MSVCPCRVKDEIKLNYSDCCLPYISGTKTPPTPEALMRSRYAAYVLNNISYIEMTQTADDKEGFNKEEAQKWSEGSDWLGLEIKNTNGGGTSETSGVVEFIAHYRDKKTHHQFHHHETSVFEKHDGIWKFIQGEVHGANSVKRIHPKIGRNDPCSCGSGKKFKKCCGA